MDSSILAWKFDRDKAYFHRFVFTPSLTNTSIPESIIVDCVHMLVLITSEVTVVRGQLSLLLPISNIQSPNEIEFKSGPWQTQSDACMSFQR
jgi:hypothetical protein